MATAKTTAAARAAAETRDRPLLNANFVVELGAGKSVGFAEVVFAPFAIPAQVGAPTLRSKPRLWLPYCLRGQFPKTAANRNTFTRFRVAQHLLLHGLTRTEVIHSPLPGAFPPTGGLATGLLGLFSLPETGLTHETAKFSQARRGRSGNRFDQILEQVEVCDGCRQSESIRRKR